VHGYVELLTATIDRLQASRYSDGDGHANGGISGEHHDDDG
jgi:hypothetical protein